MKNYMLFKFHGDVILVPTQLVSADLIDAVEKLRNAENRSAVEWTDEQQKAFLEAYCHPSTISFH